MFANLTNALDFQAKALMIRAERQQVIASNIANVDTPGYQGRDIDFKAAMSAAMDGNALSVRLAAPEGANADGTSSAGHIPLQSTLGSLNSDTISAGYPPQTEPSIDNNSVDLDHERASFVDNSVHYEATLRFISNTSKTIMSAIQGQ